MADAPRNITIEPNRSKYYLNEELVCSAEGNPPPAITWKNVLTADVSHGSVLIVSKRLKCSQMCVFQCIATNNVNGNLTNILFEISEKGKLNFPSKTVVHACHLLFHFYFVEKWLIFTQIVDKL